MMLFGPLIWVLTLNLNLMDILIKKKTHLELMQWLSSHLKNLKNKQYFILLIFIIYTLDALFDQSSMMKNCNIATLAHGPLNKTAYGFSFWLQ